MPDDTQIPLLLTQLVQHAPPRTWLGFTSILNKRARTQFFPATTEGTEQLYKRALADDAQGRNCYVQCSLLKRKPPKGRGKKFDVAGTCDLYVDLDPTPDGRRPPLPAEDVDPQPTLVVDSGRGWHLHFALAEWLPDIPTIEQANKRLAQQYENADDCWDACRLLRVPGTHNRKDPANPLPVKERLIHAAPYQLSRLLQNLPELEDEDQVDLSDPSDEPELTLDLNDELNKLPKSLRKQIKGKPATGDRSGWDYHIISRLMGCGWSIALIRELMLHKRSSISTKVYKDDGSINDTYLEHTLAKAKTELQKSGLASKDKIPILAKLIYQKRRTPDGKMIAGQPDADWCMPALRKLVTKYNVTFRRDADDTVQGYVGTTDGLLHTDSVRFDDWLQEVTGYTKESHIHSTLRAWMQTEARRRTVPTVKLRPWITFRKPTDEQPAKLTMLADLEGYSALGIELRNPLQYEVYPNGSRGELLRTSNRLHRTLPIKPPDKPIQLTKLREVFTDVLACSPVAREILTAYLLAAPLTRGFGIVTLPLLYLTGASGSGKTQTLKLISTYFHGTYKVLGDSTVASMYRGAAAEVFVPFDDYDKLSDAIKGFILSTTTGAERQKSEGKNDVVAQDLHVLLAFTSTKELEDEPLRRRALRIEINKVRWREGRAHFSEEHWRFIDKYRDSLWWAWMDVLGKADLAGLIRKFEELTQRTEKLIHVDANRPLSGFLTLLRQMLKIAAPHLGMEISPLQDWLKELKLCDEEEIQDRHELSGALDLLYERVLGDPVIRQAIIDNGLAEREADVYPNLNILCEGALSDSMDEQMQLDWSYTEDGWVVLVGSTSQWWGSLRHVTRGAYRPKTAIRVGHDFKALIGESPEHEDGNKQSRIYAVGRYRMVHLLNAGRTMSARGWRIAIRVRPKRKGKKR